MKLSTAMPTTKRRVDLEGPDFYPTPSWATKSLLNVEEFNGPIWEPACGNGAISKVLERLDYWVYSSDLYNRGYGISGVDFLSQEKTPRSVESGPWNIITNPPYHSAEEFLHKSIDFVREYKGKVALLLRLAFLEGVKRRKEIFIPKPPSRVWVFSQRITFYPNTSMITGGGTTPYAWFVWDLSFDTDVPVLGWLEPISREELKPEIEVGNDFELESVEI